MAGSPEITISPNRRISPAGAKLVYLQCYFVTIATILGTGVLGLPVTLSHSGLYPFLISFIAGFLVQALLIYFFTDILQRVYARQIQIVKEDGAEHTPLNNVDDDDFDKLEMEHESNGPVMAGHIILPKDEKIVPPNLHMMGQMFLPCCIQQMFDVVLIVQFVALLISYALAGSQAYAELLGIESHYVIPVFVWLLTFAIVFALRWIQPIVTLLTFAKGSLLLATVMVTFFVGAAVHHTVHSDFTYLGAPFLMGTVALGGVVNVMPFLYAKIQPISTQVQNFRRAIVAGLTTCTVLNILWCWAVLEIVPQRNSCFRYLVKHNNSFHTIGTNSPEYHTVCSHNLSIESAEENGEISTIPLTQIIDQLYPQYDWVAIFIELFIMISITVSYLTIGAAMHHTLNGWVDSLWNQDRLASYTAKVASKRIALCNSRCVLRCVVSLAAFVAVFAVAFSNPQGFEAVLEKVASLFINLEAGFFVFIMIRNATTSQNGALSIPLKMPPWAYHLQYIIPIYFLFAVFYDILTVTLRYLHGGQTSLPWESNWRPVTTLGSPLTKAGHTGHLYVNSSLH